MITFHEFLKTMDEELWNTTGPQDNPSNPGTKRRNATHWLNKRYGQAGGMGAPGGFGGMPMQPGMPGKPASPPPMGAPRRMKKV